MVGQHVSEGETVLRLHGAEHDPPDDLARRVLVLLLQRTLDQDPAFGLRMLVDIARRALSLAVNHPPRRSRRSTASRPCSSNCTGAGRDQRSSSTPKAAPGVLSRADLGQEMASG